MSNPQLIIFDTDAANIRSLELQLQLPFVSTAVGNGPQVTRSSAIDAMWLTLMQAERYGAQPPFPLHRAQILKTPAIEVEKGFPPLVITGVALSPDDPKDLQWQLRLIVSAMTKAIKHAEQEGVVIKRVGMLPDHLLLNKLPVAVAVPIIAAAYRQQYPES